MLTEQPATLEQKRTFRESLYGLELETGESISLFVYQKADWLTRHRISPFFQNVTREGIRL